MAKDTIPQLIQKVSLSKEGVENGSVVDFAGAFAALNLDNHYNHKAFKKGLRIDIKRLDDDVAEFDLIGVDAAIANSFRRILLAEVPTVAIERVVLHQNTGVIHDENLAHRLGLIPLLIDPALVEFPDTEVNDVEEIKFNLSAKCTKDTLSVYSRDLHWEPLSEKQKALFAGKEPRPVHDDILIAKLRPGQEIIAECYCQKGYGKEHAKWSPVSTAWYRLMPHIEVTDVKGDEAVTCLDAIPDGRLKLEKVKNHYLFTIESVGIIPASDLFSMAVARLKEKCRATLDLLQKE
eukprot:GEMP01066355.1.p1 GENE.GEMP01066355.1~~GEMP01066355.1.p1  ORF type:complete len:292 (+),score=54.27 GEMP01066355.1:65-940(+)